ncbi:TVP38/TMEM64 family protein, partial [Bacillus inaquosorum]|nr:TVP38/TMEM64 family protein [Bacillus inaquosorum]
IIPGTIALNVLGASFLTGNLPAFFMVLTLYIVFVSLPFIFRKKMQSLFQESN